MSTSRPADRANPTSYLWRKHIPGRVALAWALAGGVTAGGLLVVAMAISGPPRVGASPTAAITLFGLGMLAGVVHGGALGYLARDLSRPRSEALMSLALALAVLVLITPLAWLITLYIALSPTFLADGAVLRTAAVGLAWLAGMAICGWAAWEGWRGFGRAFVRWPERREGALILAGVLAILMLQFFMDRPLIWGTDLQVKRPGAVILAFGATIWIALPAVLVGLHLIHKLVGDRWFAGATAYDGEEARGS